MAILIISITSKMKTHPSKMEGFSILSKPGSKRYYPAKLLPIVHYTSNILVYNCSGTPLAYPRANHKTWKGIKKELASGWDCIT